MIGKIGSRDRRLAHYTLNFLLRFRLNNIYHFLTIYVSSSASISAVVKTMDFLTKQVSCNITEHNRSVLEAEILISLWPAYNVIFPAVLAVGILGNVMNLLVLTRPSLRGVTYVYLTGLAFADLGVMLAAVPAVVRFNMHHSLPFVTAFFHSYIELVLTNTFMASSVSIVCCMTLDRYFSICRPSEFKSFHTKAHAIIAISLSYFIGFIISCPLAALKTPCVMGLLEENGTRVTPISYSFHENRKVTTTTAWRIYLWFSEPAMRILPAVVLAVLNCLIINSFRKLAKHQRKVRNEQTKFRRRLGTTERQIAVRYRLYLEEQRLVHLLTSIIITFFVTMTPPTILSLIYSDNFDDHFGFQIFRAVANILEISNFALNFFIYCLCSKQFRGAVMSLFHETKTVKNEIIELDTTKNNTSYSKE